MPTYIAFGDWTEQGMRAISDSPRRLDAVKRELEEMGGRFIAFSMTLGKHVTVHPPCRQAASFTGMLGRDEPFRAAAIRSRA